MSQTVEQRWLIDADSDTPLSEQIYARLRARIVHGELKTGQPLPPSRQLASQLGVSRTTVVNAYDQLTAEGFVKGRQGSGIYVQALGDVELPQQTVEPPSTPATQERHFRPLHPGQPDMALFPYRQWARCVSRVARKHPESLIRSRQVFGDPDLRESICRYLADWRGLSVSPEQILMTAGSVDALEICIRTLTGHDDSIAIENPCYPPLRAFIQALGQSTQTLPVSAEGASLPPRKNAPRLAILTPSHQFPLGGAMPTARRLAFIQWAKDCDGWIIEDDYDSEFRYAGRPIPALSSFDGEGRSIYVGSFSKIFSDGLRLGFVVVPKRLIAAFEATLKRFSTKTSVAVQRPLAEFIDSGEFYRHIRRTRRLYAERRRHLIGLIDEHLSDYVDYTDHQAGMQIALHLRHGWADTELCQRIREKQVSCLALSDYFHDQPSPQGLLIGFCGYQPEEMTQSVRVIRDELISN